jgi:hypothetical protein
VVNETIVACGNDDKKRDVQMGIFSLKSVVGGGGGVNAVDAKQLFRVANTDVVYTSSLKSKTQTKFNAALKDIPNVIWFNEPILRQKLFGYPAPIVSPENMLDPFASRQDLANRLYEESLNIASSDHIFVCWPVKEEPANGKIVVFRGNDMMEQRKDFYLL